MMLNDHNSDMIDAMAQARSTPGISFPDLLEASFAADPALREQWDAEVLARAFGHAILRYRQDHGLSQSALGRRLGMPQSQIARIEDGQHNPSFPTLLRVCDALGLELRLEIRPRRSGRPPVPAARGGIAEVSDQALVVLRRARRRATA